MWRLFGMTILLSRAVIGNINEENAYYLTQGEDDRSSEVVESQEESKLGTSEATSLDEDQENDQQQSENGSLLDYTRLNSERKRSIVHVDLRDRMPEHRQAPAPLATLLYWPDQEDQVIGMEERRNPLIQERRNPSFSPWGGKRDLERYKTVTKIRRPVRVPFNSWGGKRSGDDKKRFGNSKRDESLIAEGKKSPPFNSWGGKRSTPYIHTNFDGTERLYDSNNHWTTPKSGKNSKMSNNFDFDPLISNIERFPQSGQWISKEIQLKRREPLKLLENRDFLISNKMTRNNFNKKPLDIWKGKRAQKFAFDSDDQTSTSVALILNKNERLLPWTK